MYFQWHTLNGSSAIPSGFASLARCASSHVERPVTHLSPADLRERGGQLDHGSGGPGL